MLGLLGLGTGKPSFTAFSSFFRIVADPPRFTYQALLLSLAKVLLRPSTLLFITVLSFTLFDLDFDIVWEVGEEEDADNDTQQDDLADSDRIGT